MTSRERRMAAASAYTDVVSKLLLPHEDIFDALSDESVALLDRLAGVVYAVAETLLARDEQANYERAGIAAQCPDRVPAEISPEDAQLIVDVAETMFTGAMGRGCRGRTEARQAESAA